MKKIIKDLLYKDLSYQIHGAVIEVRKDFGSGHKEKLYQQALAKELERRGIKFEKEKAIKIYSPKDGEFVGLYRPDFIIDGKIVMETKAEKFVGRDEIKRIYDYLRNSEYELAYFINFASPRLYVRRIVYTNKYKQKAGLNVVALLAFISLTLASFSGLRAHATSIKVYFSAPREVALGQEFQVRLLADSDQPLNAYSLRWTFPADRLELVGFNNANSIIGVWQNQPVVSVSGEVKFDGGSLRAFTGAGGELLTANFRAIKTGEAEFRFGDTLVFLANGKGTKVAPAMESVKISAKEPGELPAGASTGSTSEVLIDKIAPEIQFLSLEKDPFNAKQKLLGFMVRDSGSGIKEVQARFRSLFFWSDWQIARNPTAVPASAWAVGFRVADNKGNIAERTIYDWGAFARLASVVAAAAVVVLGFWYYLRRRRRGAPSNTNIEQSATNA